MGECIIARSGVGGGSNNIVITTNLPVLNENYPMDVQFKYSTSGCILNVLIDMYPTDCTYQWYMNNQIIPGETSYSYTFIPTEDVYATYNIYCVVSNSLGSVTSRTSTVIVYPTILYIFKENVGFGYDNKTFTTSSNMSWQTIDLEGAIPQELRFYTRSTSLQNAILSKPIPTSLYNTIHFEGLLNDNLYNDWNTALYQMVSFEEENICLFYPKDYEEWKSITISTNISSISSDYHLKFQIASYDGTDTADLCFSHIYLE